MSSQLAEKKPPREQQSERQPSAAPRHAHRRARLGAALLVALALGGITYMVSREGSKGGTPVSATATPMSTPFGPHFEGLVQRRRAARVPTMMDTMNSRVHTHPRLKVSVNGRQIVVPPDIGIDPRADSMQMAGLHTHDASGTIHVEGAPGARLGQFFAVWGVPFSAARLGPYHTAAGSGVRMSVDGKPSTAFGTLKLTDGQRIVVSFGARHGLPSDG